MRHFTKLEYYWTALISITLFNTLLGEGFDAIFLVNIIVALTVTYKGLVIIDHFMELKGAHKYLRLMMRTYFIVFPSLVIISAFF